MNISALNTLRSILPSYTNSTTQASSAASGSNIGNRRKATFENSDGDTVQLSMPPDIKGFLDKVRDGTVTDNDIQEMQDKLVEFEQSAQAQLASNSNAASRQGDGPDIKSFLDKVKAGTVTETDLSNMKDQLTKADQQGGPPPGGPPSGGPPPGGPPPGGPPPVQGTSGSGDSSSTDSEYDTFEKLLEALTAVAEKKKQESTDTGTQDLLTSLIAQISQVTSSTKSV
jgi:hypothetical protein